MNVNIFAHTLLQYVCCHKNTQKCAALKIFLKHFTIFAIDTKTKKRRKKMTIAEYNKAVAPHNAKRAQLSKEIEELELKIKLLELDIKKVDTIIEYYDEQID